MNRPFNEAKYKALLEGLEISIKTIKEFEENNPTKRLDSEFFKKDYLELYITLFKNKCEKLEFLSKWITQGPNPSFSEYGIPCLTGRNINKGRVNYKNSDYVNETEYNSLKRFQLKIGDTLITLKGKGSIGKIGYVTNDRNAIFSRDIGIIRPNKINTAYVNAFILSKFGKKIIERGETGGTGQSTLATSYLKNIDIPRLGIEKVIGDLIIRSEEILYHSQITYLQAEKLLLETLVLTNFIPSTEKTNIKNFNESFLSTGRLDAEYYQPKYEDILKRIKEHKYEHLADIVSIKKSIEPGSNAYSEEGLPFLRVADYNKMGISEPQKCLSISYVKENTEKLKRLKPKAETILFSKDGSVGTAYMIKEDMNIITSGAILHLKVKKKEQVLPEYLTLVLNSQLVQMQAERDAGGSIILHWRVGEIENVVIPIVDINIQQQISTKVTESFRLRKQSELLLELAKNAVELAIEEDEKNATLFIEKRLIELGI